jgi:hypothetical protein
LPAFPLQAKLLSEDFVRENLVSTSSFSNLLNPKFLKKFLTPTAQNFKKIFQTVGLTDFAADKHHIALNEMDK